MALGRVASTLIALLVVFCLHVGSKIINRVILELLCHYDKDDKSISCSFLVFVLLFVILRSRSCHFVTHSIYLVGAEILLQLVYLFWFLKLHFLLVCDIFPFTDKYWFGSIAVWKILLLLLLLYVIWFHILPMIELKVNWDDHGHGKSSSDDCCDSACDSKASKASKCDCPPPPRAEPKCETSSPVKSNQAYSRSCGSSPKSSSCYSPRSSGDC